MRELRAIGVGLFIAFCLYSCATAKVDSGLILGIVLGQEFGR